MTPRFLLDTHVLIWALADPQRLREPVRERLADPMAEVFVSAASTWEIAIKAGLGKLPAPPPDLPEILEQLGFGTVLVTIEDTLAVQTMPLYHRDPFDRLLLAQAQRRGLTLVTADAKMSAYGIPLLVA